MCKLVRVMSACSEDPIVTKFLCLVGLVIFPCLNELLLKLWVLDLFA